MSFFVLGVGVVFLVGSRARTVRHGERLTVLLGRVRVRAVYHLVVGGDPLVGVWRGWDGEIAG